MSKSKSNLSQRIADELSISICDKKLFKPGEKLPNELELSENLGVSRATLREAIRILVDRGLLVVKRGLGTFVSETIDQYTSIGSMSKDDVSSLKVTLRDLFEARMIIEPEAAYLAAKRASDEEIDEILRLGKIVQDYIKKDAKGHKRIESETEFHSAIMRAAHNDFLSRFTYVLTETIEKTFEMNENLEIIAEEAYKDHIMIMNFLKKRDALALKSAVLIHLHHAALIEQLPFDK